MKLSSMHSVVTAISHFVYLSTPFAHNSHGANAGVPSLHMRKHHMFRGRGDCKKTQLKHLAFRHRIDPFHFL